MSASPPHSDIKIVVAGAGGRMGRMLIKTIGETPGAILHAALEHAGSPHMGADAGTLAGVGLLNVPVTSDPLAAIVDCDAIIDFTTPATSVELAALAAQARVVHVIGTTGIEAVQMNALHAASRHAIIVQSGNMSLGVNLLAAVVERVSRALDASWDIEIVEMHHRMKVDAPSGTALLLGEAAARGRNITLDAHSDRGRDGHTGARREGDIGFAALRGGSVVGDHTVILATQGERIELSHRAEDRSIFARGAVKAALWGHGRKPGFYSMADVLGINS